MKKITTKQFQQLTDIKLVWDFMVEVYDNRFANGVAAPFFEYALTSSWMDKTYLHLNRLWFDGDKVVAFVFTESPVTSVFFNLRPGYEELAAELVTHAEENMPNFGEQELVLFAGQEALRKEVEHRGYTVSWENVDYIFDFTKGDLAYPLPEGFHFVDPLKSDPVKLLYACGRALTMMKKVLLNIEMPKLRVRHGHRKERTTVFTVPPLRHHLIRHMNTT